MNFVIRRMQAGDVPAVAELDAISFSQPWPPKAFAVELENNIARCWVTEMDGRVVAALVIWQILDEAHVATIAVHPDVRRQGIGSALFKFGLDDAIASGAQVAQLEVRASNLAAQNMYRSFGFGVVGRRPKYYQDNGEDALLMTWNIKESAEQV